MEQRQSRRLGWGHLLGPRTTQKGKARVFEALVPTVCHRCGRPLEVGEYFTRGRSSVRICWLCQPFRYPADGS
jgi:hypothetical protein